MNEIHDIWCGYLEAGDKSSPVLIDPNLETGNSKTVYMYNHNAQRIIEYKREIAEPKLRTLNEQEASLVNSLKQGYDSARKQFAPRNNTTILSVATAAIEKATSRKKADLDNIDTMNKYNMDEYEMDDDIDLDDDLDADMDSDEE